MPTSPDGFTRRLNHLKADIVDQGRRVQALIEAAFDAAFSRDAEAARRVVKQDEVIDRVDIDIERACVTLLADATREHAALEPEQLRIVLTVVKANNELERIADAAVSVAELITQVQATGQLPDTLRVMTNSVVGIIRDVNMSLDHNDPELAKVVLASEDAVLEFKRAIVRDAQERLRRAEVSVDFAFGLQEIASACERMADHCTNIAEQVIYSATGAIVRHTSGHWEEFKLPTG
ncbi:MAG: hypothetical protein H7Y88_10380 [Phycisphaerales bacterium]|nr:hypothetical protein [Phycisphaerales bacterium]